MNRKQRQRFGSAIASTILCFAAVSVAAVEKAQAAVLTYNFQVEQGGPGGFFKLSDSSLSRIGDEEIAVSEGRLNGFTSAFSSKEYDNLAGEIVLFYQGEFRGLRARGSDSGRKEINIPAEVPGGPYYIKYEAGASWRMNTNGRSSAGMWTSYFSGSSATLVTLMSGQLLIIDRTIINDAKVSYTLVDTAAEPVPEPITIAGTGLALVGLSWLKHKKKMAA